MTSNLEESFGKYKQEIIAAVVLGAIVSYMLPFDNVFAQTMARDTSANARLKILSGQPITSSDLFPSGNMGHFSTGSNNVGNNDHGTNTNGNTFGNNNGGTTTNGAVFGNGNL